jgi:DNA-binding transcriptional ArsR family regulator
MPEQVDVFLAIADPKRRKIIEMLAVERDPLTLNTISDRFAVSRQAIRKHIDILQRAGLVNLEKRSREKYCRFNAEPLHTAYQWLAVYEQFWQEKLLSLGRYLDDQTGASEATGEAP